ncbi:MAG: hypothetical protein U9O86_07990 [Campylobacterota bacterium]|nr:hypothetical protein [Campylobacterota bacterium]
MQNHLKSLVYVILTLLILASCSSEDSPNATAVLIEDAYVENTSAFNSGDTISLKYDLVSSGDNKNIEIIYSLISTAAKESQTGDEDNLTTIIIPDIEYHIGGNQLDVQTGFNSYNANVVLPMDMQEGMYQLAVKLDGQKSQKLVTYPNGNIFHDDDSSYMVSNGNVHPDLVMHTYALDEDVLLLSKDKSNVLSSTVSISSKYYDSTNIPISVCIDINGDCKSVNILSSDGVAEPEHIVDELYGYVTNITLNLEIPTTLTNEILDAIENDIYTTKVYTQVDKNNVIAEQEDDSNNQVSTPLTLYNVDNAPLVKSDGVLIEYSKNFTLDKMGKTSGSMLTINSKAGVEIEKTYAYTHGDLNLKILSKEFNFLHIGVDATFIYNSFADTGVTRRFEFLGYTLQEYKDLRDDIKSGINDFNDIKNEVKSLPENWNTTMEAINKLDLIQIASDATEATKEKINSANQKKINALIKSKLTLGALRNFSTIQKKEYQEEFMLSIVPVTVTAGAGGEYGLNQDISLLGITGFEVSVAPFANIGGFASGGVGMPGFSAGVEAAFTFIAEELAASADFQLSLQGDDTSLFLHGESTQLIDNTITGPKGNIDLYAEYTIPKICIKKWRHCVEWHWNLSCKKYHTTKVHYPCGVVTHKPTKNIFSWKSFETTKNILDKNEQILQEQLY